MAAVLTADAQVVCSHQGTVAVAAGGGSLLMSGSPVLVMGDMEGSPVSGCSLQSPATPCTAVVSTLAGISAVLAAGGAPVLLDTATGVTNSVPPGTWQVRSAGQTTFTAT